MGEFDIAIVGAGPAGAACGTLLARQGLKVALLDRARFPRDKVCGDGITPRGTRALERLGILAAVTALAQAHRGVTIRGANGHSCTIPFLRDPDHPSDLLVVPRRILDHLLLEHAIRCGATFLSGIKVIRVEERDAGKCVIHDSTGEIVQSRLVVFATGAESQLLRATGLLATKPLLEHAARVYFDDVDGLDENVTLFFDGVDMPGYGWIFPTGARSANIGCGVFDQRGTRQTKRLEQLLAEHPLLRSLLKNARQLEPIKSYPLRTDFRAEYAGRAPFACIGEAAGLVNPITGEGIDYAFESAEFLAAAVAAHWGRTSAGTLAVVEDYRRRVQKRFALRFRIYHWVQRHCLSGVNSAEFLALLEVSPSMQRALVNGLFGRTRMSHLLDPRILGPGLRLAWKGRQTGRLAHQSSATSDG